MAAQVAKTCVPASTKVSPLSNPKHVKHCCELCGKPAYLQCQNCRVTFYCSSEHHLTDHKGIHEKICSLLVPIRMPVAVFGSEEERVARERVLRQQRLHVLELSKTEAHKKLYEGQFDLAIPAALQALRFSMDVYDQAKSWPTSGTKRGGLAADGSLKLVPCFLLLGEASIGLKQYAQAEDYLSLAKWAIIKAEEGDAAARSGSPAAHASARKAVAGEPGSPGPSPKHHPAAGPSSGIQIHEIRSQLHRNFGLLYASKKMWAEAAAQLAEDVYYLSLVFGPDHFQVSGGYFHLANVFQGQGIFGVANAVYDKIIDIWDAYWRKGPAKEQLDEAQQAEAHQILTTIDAFRQKESAGASPLATARLPLLLSRLYTSEGSVDKSRKEATRALRLCGETPGLPHAERKRLRAEVLQFFAETLKEEAPEVPEAHTPPQAEDETGRAAATPRSDSPPAAAEDERGVSPSSDGEDDGPPAPDREVVPGSEGDEAAAGASSLPGGAAEDGRVADEAAEPRSPEEPSSPADPPSRPGSSPPTEAHEAESTTGDPPPLEESDDGEHAAPPTGAPEPRGEPAASGEVDEQEEWAAAGEQQQQQTEEEAENEGNETEEEANEETGRRQQQQQQQQPTAPAAPSRAGPDDAAEQGETTAPDPTSGPEGAAAAVGP